MDPAQIRHLFDRHGASLVLYARQWCRYPDDAVQEAFLDLIDESIAPDVPVAWLFKVVKRKAMNLARAEQRRSKYQQRASQPEDAWFDVQHAQRLVEEEVEATLVRLSDVERQIVVSRVWGELTFEQIAELVDMSSSAVHRHYHRALGTMSSLLGEPTKR